MKRFLIGICVLSLLLALGIGITLAFQRIHLPVAMLLHQATEEALAGDWDAAATHVQDAYARWEHYRHFSAAFADHAPMDEIDGLFAQLEVSKKSREHFPALCAQLAQHVEAIAESHRFHWWTLL